LKEPAKRWGKLKQMGKKKSKKKGGKKAEKAPAAAVKAAGTQ
jgi:hypothetical protein